MSRRGGIIAEGAAGAPGSGLAPSPWGHWNAATLGLTEGEWLTEWPNSSGPGPDLTLNSNAATFKGVFKAAWSNGLPGVEFPNAHRIHTAGNYVATAPVWITHVVFDSNNAGTSHAGILWVGSSRDVYRIRPAGVPPRTVASSWAQIPVPAVTVPDGTMCVLTLVHRVVGGVGASYGRISIPGTDEQSAPGGSATFVDFGQIGLGNRGYNTSNASSLMGCIGEWIIYDRDIGDEAVVANHDFLMTKYGVAA